MQNNGDEIPDQAISQEEGLKQFVHWLFEIYSTLHTSYLILVAHECRDFQQILLEKNLLKCGAKFDRSNIFCGCSILFGFDRILDVTFADSLDVMRKIYRDSCIQYIAIYVRIYVCIFFCSDFTIIAILL